MAGTPLNKQAKRQRRAARDLALQMLFQVDVGRIPLAEVLEALRTGRHIQERDEDESPEPLAEPVMDYAEQLVRGTAAHRQELDRLVARHAQGWTLDRLASVDRNLLRIAIYEMLHVSDVPVPIAIDEAVELAKVYGTEESSRYVNGILGAVARAFPESEEAAAESLAARAAGARGARERGGE